MRESLEDLRVTPALREQPEGLVADVAGALGELQGARLPSPVTLFRTEYGIMRPRRCATESWSQRVPEIAVVRWNVLHTYCRWKQNFELEKLSDAMALPPSILAGRMARVAGVESAGSATRS